MGPPFKSRTRKRQHNQRQLCLMLKSQKFTLFPNLPLELRLKIWRHALPEPRIVKTPRDRENKVIGNMSGEPSTGQVSVRKPPIHLLQVCRESRQETLMIYRPMLSAQWNDRQVYVDYNIDTCYIATPSRGRRIASWIPDPGSFNPFVSHYRRLEQ
jgi:hypothetical protein